MVSERAQTPSAKKGMFFLAVIGVVILAIAAFIFVQRGEESPVNVPTERARPLSVNVASVHFSDRLHITEQFTGIVVARRSSALGFETGGRIVSVAADIGDQVSEGQVLARIDTRALNARLRAAEAQKTEAEAALQLAQTTRERQAFLIERELLSSQTYDEVQSQVDAAQARLNAAEAQIDTLRVQIELSAIRAPFAGVITQRRVDEGAIAAPGQPVLELVEAGVPEVRIGVPQAIAERLRIGEAYDVAVLGQSVSASLRALTGVIDASERTVSAVFELPEESGISPGATARLSVVEELDQQGFWIPVSALTEASRGLWSVYVVSNDNGENTIHRQLVDVLHSETERVFVRGALQEGDLFVMDGLHRLVPGMSVTPVVHSDIAREN